MIGPKILVITPVHHIGGVTNILESAGEVTYLDNPTPEEVRQRIGHFEALYTNPNMSNVYISKDLIDAGEGLKIICTASTGTNHIDVDYAAQRDVTVLSLKEERQVINRISSTAEHAFALMMASLRHIVPAWESVKRGEWEYLPYIGRQLDHLTIGIVGYGRLGRLFAGYCKAFNSRVLVHDPYAVVEDTQLQQVGLTELFKESDAVSLHVHVTLETTGMVNKKLLTHAKSDLVLINTSRGEICDEDALIGFLKSHPSATYATDVLSAETLSKDANKMRAWALNTRQVLITPHIGGMTVEGQRIAYVRAAERLSQHLASLTLDSSGGALRGQQ